MINDENTKTVPLSIHEETAKQIEEAAYYSWLNRGRYAQPGDELSDWIEGEKEVRDGSKGFQSVLSMESLSEKLAVKKAKR